MDNSERDRLARKGAEVELAEVERRRSELLAFLGKKATPPATAGNGAKRGRPPMSPEQKQALSQKMKKKWEEGKKGKGAPELPLEAKA